MKLVEGGAGKEDYYIGIYKLFYEGCNSSTGKVDTTKSTWCDDDPASHMMNKTQIHLRQKSKALNLNMDDDSTRVLMDSTWPWSLFWDSFMNEVHQLKIASIKETMQDPAKTTKLLLKLGIIKSMGLYGRWMILLMS